MLAANARLGWSRHGAKLRPVQRSHFAFDVPFIAVNLQEALGQFDRFFHGSRVQDRKAAYDLLGLCKRSINCRQFAVPKTHPHALAVGRSPAVEINTPSRVIFSMSLPRSLMSCSLGTRPLFSSIRIIERNRISASRQKRWMGTATRSHPLLPLSSRTAGRWIDIDDKSRRAPYRQGPGASGRRDPIALQPPHALRLRRYVTLRSKRLSGSYLASIDCSQ